MKRKTTRETLQSVACFFIKLDDPILGENPRTKAAIYYVSETKKTEMGRSKLARRREKEKGLSFGARFGLVYVCA